MKLAIGWARRNWILVVPLLLSGISVLPLLFLASGSLMSSLELVQRLAPVLGSGEGYVSWRLIPEYVTLQPYVELLFDSPAFFVMFWNSVKLACGSLMGQLVVALPAAWWFATYPGRVGRGLFTLYMVLMLMPFQVTMVSSYLVLDWAGLLDSHWAILLPGVFSTFPVFIVYRFFKGIPRSILESARIDGASEFRIFWHIGLPLGKAGVAAAMVLGFLEYWNLIEQPMTFLKTQSLWPLSLYLPQITASQAGLALAASVVTLIPALLVFLYGQTYLEQGIVAAGVKE